MDDSEGAHRWMQVFDELRARGVEDVLYVSSDGVAGLGEGLASVFPRAVRRRCVVHLVRNSLRYVPQVGRGLPPRGVVAGPKPVALRRVDQAEDRALPIGSRSGDLHRLLDMP